MKDQDKTILVWDTIFYTEDKEGKVQKYRPTDKLDFSHIAEYVEMKDLVPIKETDEVTNTGRNLGKRIDLCETWLNVSDTWVKARISRTENGDLEVYIEDSETHFPLGTCVQGYNDEIIISKYETTFNNGS